MKLAPHLHRLGNDIVASYLVDLPEGILLVDAGMPGHWNDLRRELTAIGRPLSDIKGIVLTHGDSDHIGFAERLRREADVPVLVHEADAVRTRTGAKPSTPMGPSRFGPMMGFFAYGIRKNALRTKYVQEVVTVGDGDVLDLPGSPVVIGMPGHSPGSIAVHVPAADAVFVGDALTTRHVLTGAEGPQPAPFTDAPADALRSLDRIADLPVSWVLPGHGAPWHGSAADLVAGVRTG